MSDESRREIVKLRAELKSLSTEVEQIRNTASYQIAQVQQTLDLKLDRIARRSSVIAERLQQLIT
ncbi:MAG TPA: hypothetical protein VJS44_08285 [Pyrinomonadaceae bacterium]|nr:hypothetical protein [Pyrinomonadaceae bacterium]